VEIAERTPILQATYERVVGRVRFGMKPALAANRIVCDLDLVEINDADEWVMKQGFTLVWLGWEWDIPTSNRDALHFTAPMRPPTGW